MDFGKLKLTDCSKYIEKKGKFSYLSWPYMVEQLRTHMPLATIQARKSPTGIPYFKDESGAMVETYILEGETELWSEWLPVMNFKNQSITNPNSMDVNKAIQRCKAKCISEYLGIGLYIYMGEDLPEKTDGNVPPENTTDKNDDFLPEQPPIDYPEGTFIDQMKWYAKHEPVVYKKYLAFWQVDSATKITDPTTQMNFFNDIEKQLDYNR
jgi:hypothetical protein